MTDVDYVRPCKTRETRDGFKAHVARGSVLPGLDYACDTGDKVFATADGKVIQADNNPNDVRGRSIQIRHPDGRRSHYLHLSELKVKNGDHVKAGELIALSGNTGTTSTGAHLHFAIQGRDGHCLDPENLLKKELIEARKERKAVAKVAEVIAPEPTHLP